ncbi:MAG: zinc-ribbon domain [Pseudomonadota bacterium]
MRVVCDNCGASYKIPDSKLVKEVNHATCRKCGHRIVISRREGPNTEPGVGEAAPGASAGQGDGTLSSDAASTLINEGGGRAPMRPPMGFGGADEVPAALGRAPAPEPREATVPRDSAFAASMSARGNDAPTLPPPSGPTPQQLAAQQQQQAAQAAYAAQQQAVFAAQQQQAAYAAQQQQLAMMNAQYPQNPAMTGAFPVGGASVHQAAPLPAYPPPAAPMVAAPRPHDPAPDLSWVMIASFGSAIGAGVLATSSSQPQTLIGLGISLWSAITSLMVLVTGDRGRREASVVGATVMGVVFSGLLTGAFYAAQPKGPAVAETTPPEGDVSEAMATLGADAAAPPAEATAATDPVTGAAGAVGAVTAPTEAAPTETPAAPTEPAPQGAATTTPQAVATAPTPSGSSSSGSASSGSSSSGSSSSKPSGSSSSGSSSSKPTGSSSSGSSTASKPTTTAAAPASSGVPLSVLDTMLKTNANVKKCFVLYKQETGELPSRVDVKLTVQPSGKTTAASVKTEQYKGTSLDGCLGTAIKGITFPGFEGSAQDYSYPFVLR